MRSRNIKPGFFENEVLATLPHWVRLLFIGLWCMADRSGRLEDRPARVARALFAGEDLDVDSGLSMLANAGFISRYTVEGIACIQVLAWARHQSPHVKERESNLPPMPGSEVDAPCLPGAGTVNAPCVSDADTEQAQEHPDARPPDSLIPDTQFNNSDSKPARQAPNASPTTNGNASASAKRVDAPRHSQATTRESPGKAALTNSESPAENQAAYERHLREMGCEP